MQDVVEEGPVDPFLAGHGADADVLGEFVGVVGVVEVDLRGDVCAP